jgi:branched-chain amino acid transport system ATP-binding protein
MSDIVLRTDALTRRFGGLTAVREVSIACRFGEIHAVIGPNGAGKSTLVNLLSGELAPSSGTVHFDDRDITGMANHRIARLGMARSYQKTNIFLPLSAFENCRLAAQATLGHSMRFFRPALSNAEVNSAAEEAMSLAGLSGRRHTVAATLSHGEQRQLEIAMALATRPRLLLLDEPLAGMGSEESTRIVELLARLGRDHAILLIEHDMDAVFAVATVLTVMVNGAVLESGTPDAIRDSHAVQEAYLGTETAHA